MAFVAGTLALGAVIGCRHSRLAIQYQPATPVAVAYVSNVALRIVDARAADRGGIEKARVGTFRNNWGVPAGVFDEFPDVAPRTVADATADALRRVGIGVGAAEKTLVVTITDYWMDGYMGYAWIAVRYQMFDAAERPIWFLDVGGGSGGFGPGPSTTWNGQTAIHSPGVDPKRLARQMFDRALNDFAFAASEAFRAPAFQQALLRG